MTRAELAHELWSFAEGLGAQAVESELGPVMPLEELAGLAPRIRATVSRLVDELTASEPEGGLPQPSPIDRS